MAKAKSRSTEEMDVKILDVDASMQGTITFHDPVNLRINGNFDGQLDTKGSLSIGENSIVNASITGDRVIIAGKVNGNIVASESVAIVAPANVQGDVRTPLISITEGAILNGKVDMSQTRTGLSQKEQLTLKEVAQYLEVESSVLEEWAAKKKIPAYYEKDTWKFKKSEIERWIQEEKIKV